jgi:hypothetical protein
MKPQFSNCVIARYEATACYTGRLCKYARLPCGCFVPRNDTVFTDNHHEKNSHLPVLHHHSLHSKATGNQGKRKSKIHLHNAPQSNSR